MSKWPFTTKQRLHMSVSESCCIDLNHMFFLFVQKNAHSQDTLFASKLYFIYLFFSLDLFAHSRSSLGSVRLKKKYFMLT